MLVFVRHGESDHNAAGRLVGRSDPPLTERGVLQAEACAAALAKEFGADSVPVVVTSPLQRAAETARAIALRLGSEVTVDPRLVELDYGELDGVAIADVDQRTWTAWKSDPSWRPVDGESLLEVQERVSRFCDDHLEAAAADAVIAVTHVSPVKAAACWALGAEPSLTWRMSLPVASVTRIALGPPALRSFGETAHLLAGGLVSEPPRTHSGRRS